MPSPSVPGPAASNLIDCKTVAPLTLECPPRFGLAQAQPEIIYSCKHTWAEQVFLCISIWNGLHSHSGTLHTTGHPLPWYLFLIHPPVLCLPIIFVWKLRRPVQDMSTSS
jgi:hypothetical protein